MRCVHVSSDRDIFSAVSHAKEVVHVSHECFATALAVRARPAHSPHPSLRQSHARVASASTPSSCTTMSARGKKWNVDTRKGAGQWADSILPPSPRTAALSEAGHRTSRDRRPKLSSAAVMGAISTPSSFVQSSDATMSPGDWMTQRVAILGGESLPQERETRAHIAASRTAPRAARRPWARGGAHGYKADHHRMRERLRWRQPRVLPCSLWTLLLPLATPTHADADACTRVSARRAVAQRTLGPLGTRAAPARVHGKGASQCGPPRHTPLSDTAHPAHA